MLLFLAAIVSFALQTPAQSPSYLREDAVEFVRAASDLALPSARVIAIAGDRLHVDRRGIRVNEQLVDGVSQALLEQFTEPWDQVVPAGHYFVVAEEHTQSGKTTSSVRFHGLIPAEKIARKVPR
jgi:hypothetical protein